MKQSTLETVIGALVILVAGYFLYFALHNLEHKKQGGYELTARFSNIDGVAPGTAVRVSGVKVGTVSKVTLDPVTYLATVHMELEPDLQLPVDTVASINTPSLLGEKNLTLEPGNDDKKLKPNDMIVNTESAASIEHLLGQVIFSLQNLGKGSPAPGAPSVGTPGVPAPSPDASGDHP
jgi:phospholipid/cholesterol/gamma-HCH transport system substrate-binding protein